MQPMTGCHQHIASRCAEARHTSRRSRHCSAAAISRHLASCVWGPQDHYLRAFDTASDEEVWSARLPVGTLAGP